MSDQKGEQARQGEDVVSVLMHFNSRFDDQAKVQNDRHSEVLTALATITTSVQTINKRADGIESAFLKTEMDAPDFQGHYVAHYKDRIVHQDKRDIMQEGKKRLLGGIGSGIFAVLLYSVVSAFKDWVHK